MFVIRLLLRHRCPEERAVQRMMSPYYDPRTYITFSVCRLQIRAQPVVQGLPSSDIIEVDVWFSEKSVMRQSEVKRVKSVSAIVGLSFRHIEAVLVDSLVHVVLMISWNCHVWVVGGYGFHFLLDEISCYSEEVLKVVSYISNVKYCIKCT